MYLIRQQTGFIPYYVYAYDQISVRFIHRRDLARKWPRREDAQAAASEVSRHTPSVTLEIEYLPGA